MNSNIIFKCISDFVSIHLPVTRNVSKNTISSYCDTYRLLFTYVRDSKNISIEKFSISDFDDVLIKDFLVHLESERECAISTRNQRLSAIHSLARYIQIEVPQAMFACQKILNIPFKKRNKPTVAYLTHSDMKSLLAQPDSSTKQGRRDLTLLCLMYDTGARVQEIADLKVRDIFFRDISYVKLCGKGRKSRLVPLLDKTVNLLNCYLEENCLLTPDKSDFPLFLNRQNSKFSRAGIAYILQKYVSSACSQNVPLPDKVTPHVLRHTKAMHLAEADVNPIYIRDFLGHEDISTINHYIQSSMTNKRKALEKTVSASPDNLPSWSTDKSLISWLKAYGK